MISKKVVASLIALVGSFALTACEGENGNNNNAGPNNNPNPPAENGSPNGNNNAPTADPSVRAAQPTPIKAVFTQATYTTEYTVDIDNADRDELTVGWMGPNCGPWFPENKVITDAKGATKMSWNHMSPPCPEHAHHDDVTVTLVVVGKRSGRTVQCTYKGAASGTGPACFQQGFSGSEFGTATATNQAHIRYRNPQKQCSRVELIQVMSVWRKGPPDRLVIPHNDGMDESEPGPLGYQVPAVADDADGYVVDKFFYQDISTNDPYYGGAEKGSQTRDASLDDRPNNTRDGHKAVFEVCAFCSGNPTDAEYGNYLDCITWEHDADSGRVQRTEPQPTGGPSQGFRNAVSKWNQNKSFTMPAK